MAAKEYILEVKLYTLEGSVLSDEEPIPRTLFKSTADVTEDNLVLSFMTIATQLELAIDEDNERHGGIDDID